MTDKNKKILIYSLIGILLLATLIFWAVNRDAYTGSSNSQDNGQSDTSVNESESNSDSTTNDDAQPTDAPDTSNSQEQPDRNPSNTTEGGQKFDNAP